MIETEKYDRIRIYKPEQVLKYVSLNPEDKPRTIKFSGVPVFMGSKRYLNFKAHGLTCVECGLTGTYMALEKHKGHRTDKYHFNLYGKNEKDEEIMLTKDHIVPKAKGGPDKLSNFQVMCLPCNSKKGDTYLSEEQKIHIAKYDVLNRVAKRLTILQREVTQMYFELKNECPHSIVRTSTGGARCEICDATFGWYCPLGPDRTCHYFSTGDEMSGFVVPLVTGGSFRLQERTWKETQEESPEHCIFCEEPEERPNV